VVCGTRWCVPTNARGRTTRINVQGLETTITTQTNKRGSEHCNNKRTQNNSGQMGLNECNRITTTSIPPRGHAQKHAMRHRRPNYWSTDICCAQRRAALIRCRSALRRPRALRMLRSDMSTARNRYAMLLRAALVRWRSAQHAVRAVGAARCATSLPRGYAPAYARYARCFFIRARTLAIAARARYEAISVAERVN